MGVVVLCRIGAITGRWLPRHGRTHEMEDQGHPTCRSARVAPGLPGVCTIAKVPRQCEAPPVVCGPSDCLLLLQSAVLAGRKETVACGRMPSTKGAACPAGVAAPAEH